MNWNDKALVRLFKLWTKVIMMVVDGKRDATWVADILQTILGQSRIITPPRNARIHTAHVLVKYAKQWDEAVRDGGPDTPLDWGIWKLADRFPSCDVEETKEDIIFLGYSSYNDGWEGALAWATREGLEITTPREVLSVGEQYPNLHVELVDSGPICILSSSVYERNACCVYWNNAGQRFSSLYWNGNYADVSHWLTFRNTRALIA